MNGGISINKIIKLYKEWRKEKQQFVRRGEIVEETLQEANDSFLCYLRECNVTSVDVNLGLDCFNYYWDFCQYVISFLPGYIVGSFFVQHETKAVTSIVILIIVCIIWCILFIFLKKMMQKISLKLSYSEYSFVRSALQQYKELYADSITLGHKIVHLYNHVQVKIPINAETVYSEKMQCPKYYKNSFYVVINDGHQEFFYVWYSNKDYNTFDCSTKKDFTKQCKVQIGKNWKDIDEQCFSFKNLSSTQTNIKQKTQGDIQ